MDNEYDIPYVLADNCTAVKWLKLLHHDIYVENRTWNNDRFVGFDSDKDDPKCCAGYITLAHSLIENTESIIKPRQFLKRITVYGAD